MRRTPNGGFDPAACVTSTYGGGVSRVTIRVRRDEDLPALSDILRRQQAETEYPFEWPPSMPIERFLRRDGEIAAWVADVDGSVAGHVALLGVADDGLGRMWARAHDVPISRLRCIGVLFADRRRAGQGIGSALLHTATRAALENGGAPVLDVVAHHVEPLNLYRRRGWREIGRYRTEWLPDDVDPVYVMIYPRDRQLT